MSEMKVEFGILRRPDDQIDRRTFTSLEEARAYIDASYEWKAERYREAEENRDEFAQHEKGKGPFPSTNGPKYAWDKGSFGPAIKDQDWQIVRREITAWALVED